MNASPIVPQQLLLNGQLAFHNIYRTATLSERKSALVKGNLSDEFPEVIIPANPWNRQGVLPNCNKSLVNGDELSLDQWPTLRTWHCGLSCQTVMKLNQGFLFDLDDPNFIQEFDLPRSQYLNEDGIKYRLFQIYELKKGTEIPPGIGIEMDGENRVCLYPTGENIRVSNVGNGLESFTIDAFVPLQDLWKPYAMFRVQANAFVWPDNFPDDSDSFPFRRWISAVICYGESDIAVDANIFCYQGEY